MGAGSEEGLDDGEVSGGLGEDFTACVGDENVVDDAGSELFLGEEDGGLDGEDHATLYGGVGGAVHLKAFGPSRRESGCDTVATGVPPSFFHACIADDLLGGFVGD